MPKTSPRNTRLGRINTMNYQSSTPRKRLFLQNSIGDIMDPPKQIFVDEFNIINNVWGDEDKMFDFVDEYYQNESLYNIHVGLASNNIEYRDIKLDTKDKSHAFKHQMTGQILSGLDYQTHDIIIVMLHGNSSHASITFFNLRTKKSMSIGFGYFGNNGAYYSRDHMSPLPGEKITQALFNVIALSPELDENAFKSFFSYLEGIINNTTKIIFSIKKMPDGKYIGLNNTILLGSNPIYFPKFKYSEKIYEHSESKGINPTERNCLRKALEMMELTQLVNYCGTLTKPGGCYKIPEDIYYEYFKQPIQDYQASPTEENRAKVLAGIKTIQDIVVDESLRQLNKDEMQDETFTLVNRVGKLPQGVHIQYEDENEDEDEEPIYYPEPPIFPPDAPMYNPDLRTHVGIQPNPRPAFGPITESARGGRRRYKSKRRKTKQRKTKKNKRRTHRRRR